jgi:CheY-like chemotaxis protein
MSKTILLADDSVTIQKVVELSFADEGFRVVGVANGDDALARLGEVAPDLVVADIHMPGANGYEVAARVKQMRPGTPVLLLVGTFEPFDRERYASSGADAFMKKPFDSQELLRQVQTLLAGSVRSAPATAEASLANRPEAETTAVDNPVLGSYSPAATSASRSSWTPLGDADDSPSFSDDAPPRNVETTLRMPALGMSSAPYEVPEAAPASPSPAPAAASSASAVTSTTLAPLAPAPAAIEVPTAPVQLSEVDIDRICRRVLEVLSEKVVREIGWEVVPDLAEVIIKDRLRELERQAETAN